MTWFSERCPETLATRAAALSEKACTSASQAFNRTKMVTNRHDVARRGKRRIPEALSAPM